MIETTLDTITIRKFWVGDAVMLAILEAIGGDLGHETVGFADPAAFMKVIDEDELDQHDDDEVAAWFGELIQNPEWFDADRLEVILDEAARVERVIGKLLGGPEGV
jgi:hypothetical protein